MKTNLLSLTIIISCLLISFQPSYGQKFYAGVQSGYALPMNSELIGFDRSSSQNGTSEKVLPVSYGKGIKTSFLLGYQINENFQFETNAGFLLGSKYVSEFYYSNHSTIFHDKTISSSTSLSLTPTLVYCVNKAKLNPYAKLGLVLARNTIKLESSGSNIEQYGTETETNKSHSEEYLEGKLSYGISSSLGIQWQASEHFRFFGECNMMNMSFTPDRYKLTEYSVNGVDQLGDMSIRSKETIYEREIHESNDPQRDENQPDRESAFSLPFSSIGIQMGIIVPLGL